MVQQFFYLPLKKALRDARKEARATQSDIAERAGLSVPTVRLLEQGRGTLQSLDAYLASLGLEIYGDHLPRTGDRGRRIAALRTAQRISQRALAKQIGVSPTPILTIETRWRGRVETLDAILIALDSGAYLAPINSGGYPAVSNDPVWRSVASVIDPLQSALGRFDLSPCPAEISGRVLPVEARQQFAEEDDPLNLPWKGKKVILNPPFSNDLPAWIKKAHDEYQSGTASLIAALLPAFTDRTWWHSYVANKATVVFLRGLVTFENGEKQDMPSVLAIWGADAELRRQIKAAYPESWVIQPKS